MFSNSNVLITGGTSTYVAGNVVYHREPVDLHHSLASGFKDLCAQVPAGALHNSGEVSDQPKCHPGTRVAILEHLVAWAGALAYAYPIIWLHGPAGAGKSAILRTIAQMFDPDLLVASFFFFRTAAGRNNADHFIATIAYQLALSIPATRSYIEKAVENNPLIFSLSLWHQARALIVSPILSVCDEDPSFASSPKPRVIIVDGLDECRGPGKQCDVLQVLCHILQSLPIPFAVLVASRPEHHIRDAFDFGDLNKSSSRLSLDNAYNADTDIKKYLTDSFDAIKANPRLVSYLPTSSPWPSKEVLSKLVAKASGQFIFASTVVKFVSSTRHNPARRLDIILGTLEAGNLKPFEQLDVLYSTIFFSIDPEDLTNALRVLGVLIVPYNEHALGRSRTPALLERLLHLDHGEVRHLLFDLESLLTVGRDDEGIRFFHASLSDFLFDKSRSGQLSIDAGSIYADLARHCINHLPTSADQDWTGIQYFFKDNISLFFSKATPTLELQQAIENFDFAKVIESSKEHYPPWQGIRELCPLLLDAVVNHSAFPNPEQLFNAQFITYQQLVRPAVQLYFQNVDLKYFLISSVTLWTVTRRDYQQDLLNHVFDLSSQVISADNKIGLNIIEMNSNGRATGIPPIITFLQKLFDDRNGPFFIDEDQYADMTLYILNRVHKYSGFHEQHSSRGPV
ncbi:hypothetical protein GALMADRAFT_702712 [Galerina marginata CBS 339.88]|uniref:Nephrocystin 3-like N-terminal domain-containing protein n=1 Tax=Galerina marginata (strain CBS 339.88) TaxID=685588 RepID=A0A067TYT4_GALM3|nr:hypothetical protein GALMADRAFT_702712 [Galerina marginata CBS 339.88]